MKLFLVSLAVAVLLFDGTFAKRRKSHKLFKAEQEPEALDNSNSEENLVSSEDPCMKKHCGAGQVCRLDELGEPFCKCIEDCPVETEPRRKVCSNHNTTWGSDCELYRMRCMCKKGDEGCNGVNEALKESYKHLHIDYYGECREMEECTDGQMGDFPRRMRDWLFNIMRDMAEREELSPHYLKMEKEAENNLTKRWTNAAIWKWCDLDSSRDRTVSRHELFPIRAPLVALEHCIAPFLDKCDLDNNHQITLNEWVKCLELDSEEWEDKCEDIREIDD